MHTFDSYFFHMFPIPLEMISNFIHGKIQYFKNALQKQAKGQKPQIPISLKLQFTQLQNYFLGQRKYFTMHVMGARHFVY